MTAKANVPTSSPHPVSQRHPLTHPSRHQQQLHPPQTPGHAFPVELSICTYSAQGIQSETGWSLLGDACVWSKNREGSLKWFHPNCKTFSLVDSGGDSGEGQQGLPPTRRGKTRYRDGLTGATEEEDRGTRQVGQGQAHGLRSQAAWVPMPALELSGYMSFLVLSLCLGLLVC